VSSEYIHQMKRKTQKHSNYYNEKRFISLDVTYGYPLKFTMYEYLLDNGMSREEFHWFKHNHVKARCIMGNDYYVTNEHLVRPDGRVEEAGEIFGYHVITRQYYGRYRLPVMHTETNLMDADRAPWWLHKEWMNMHELKRDGVPIMGFTWYSLTDQVDWDTALREDKGTVTPCVLLALDRKLRTV